MKAKKSDNEEIEHAMEWIPENMLKEVIEEEKRMRTHGKRAWKPFPTNKDIMRAIVHVTGGVIYRQTLQDLHWEVIERLKQEGFETRFVSSKRVWRLVQYLAEKGRITIMV